MDTLLADSAMKNPDVYLLPGVTPETIETCSRLLRDNHDHYHVYFNNEGGFHNHTAHHLLAALALGASSDTLERIYAQQKIVQKPIAPLHSSEEFDAKKCIGDDKYYHDYIKFFTEELQNEKYQGNMTDLIEDYVFNHDYLTLILGGAYHAFIHLGYALEFQSKLMTIEGLAMAAVDRVGARAVLEHLKYNQTATNERTALEIVELMIKDKRFDAMVFYKDEGPKVDQLLERGGGPLIAEYAQMWKCDIDDLRRAGVLLNAAVIRAKKAPRLDFFLMHATTSCLFLDLFVHALKNKANQTKFLQAKLAVDLLWFVGRGRPTLDVNYLCNDYRVSEEHSYPHAQNPWLPLIDKCLTHPDEHVPKTIRALVYAEKLDSTQGKEKLPYLKMAQMVMDTLFPADKKDWTRDGIGWDEHWKTVEDV